jgi:hypothetical protein
MNINAGKIKIFKIENRKGYAAICLDHLTEGKSLPQAYVRMVKALRRGGITIKKHPANLKQLLLSLK